VSVKTESLEVVPKKPLLEPREKREVKNIGLEKLFVGELNERMDVGDITGLSTSIKQVGILEPLLVRPVGDKFEIICGRRRFEGAKAAGVSFAPCHIKDMNDVDALQASYAENENRQSATPVEQGYQSYKLLQRLQDIKEVADLLGKTPQWVKGRIEAYDLHNITAVAVSAKGPRGIIEGGSASGIGLVDATMIQSALRSRSAQRALSRTPEEKRTERAREVAKELAEAIRTIDPVKKGRLIGEFKKDPNQDIRALADKITREPKGLKLSVYFTPEVGKFIEESSEEAGLSPSVWVRNRVVQHLREQGKSLPPLKEPEPIV